MHKWLFAALTTCLLFPSPSRAQEAATTLDAIVVTASRTDTKLKDMPGHTSVIPRAEIERMQARDIDELITKSLPDLNSQNGDNLANTLNRKIILQGMGEQDRTLVLLDGVPIQEPGSNWVDWAVFNMQAVDRVEVLRGPLSSLYGHGAMGGIVQIVTRDPQRAVEGNVQASAGSFDSREFQGYQGGKHDKLSYLLAGRWFQENGASNQRSPQNYHTPLWRKTDNATAKLAFEPTPDDTVKVVGIYARDIFNRGRRNLNEDRVNGLTYLNYEHRAGEARLRVTTYFLSFYEDLRADKSTNYLREDSYRPRHQAAMGGSGQFNAPVGGLGKVTVGVDGRIGRHAEQLVYESKVESINAHAKQSYVAPFFELEKKFLDDRLIAKAGGRMDFYSSYDGFSHNVKTPAVAPSNYSKRDFYAFSPRGGLTYHLDEDTTLRASGGHAFSAPRITSLYVLTVAGKTNNPNPNLDAEKLWSYELGVDRKLLPGLTGTFNYFQGWASDFTATKPVAGGAFLWVNSGRIDIYGINAGLEYTPIKPLTLRAGYSFLRSYVRENDADPTTVGFENGVSPRNRALFGLTYDEPRLAMLTSMVRYTDRSFSDLPHTAYAHSYWTMDMGLAKTFLKRLTARVDVRNVFDNRYDIFDMNGSVVFAPGRIVTGTLGYAF